VFWLLEHLHSAKKRGKAKKATERSEARERKEKIFLTYGANRFLLKCLDSFSTNDSPLFLHYIFSLSPPPRRRTDSPGSFYDITIQNFSVSLLMRRGCEEELDIMWLGDKQRRDFHRQSDNNNSDQRHQQQQRFLAVLLTFFSPSPRPAVRRVKGTAR
jgi:hypothetical protein